MGDGSGRSRRPGVRRLGLTLYEMSSERPDSHRVEVRSREGVALLALVSPTASVEVCPAAGFSAVSFRVGSTEHLRLPVGLAAYAASTRTGGVPLLHPFANRLRGTRWTFGGRTVDPDATPLRHADSKGRPMHGYLLRWPGASPSDPARSAWTIATEVDDEGAEIRGSIEWADHPELMAAFPFPHRLTQRYRLQGARLDVSVSIDARQVAVPVAFGWHPYLRIEGVAREQLSLSLPSLSHVALDADGLPIRRGGRLVEAARAATRTPLAAQAFDDLFRLGESAGNASIDSPGRSAVVLRPGANIRFLQVYSPAGADFVAVEPMTAPTAALDDGGEDLPSVPPRGAFTASFSIEVLPAPRAA